MSIPDMSRERMGKHPACQQYCCCEGVRILSVNKDTWRNISLSNCLVSLVIPKSLSPTNQILPFIHVCRFFFTRVNTCPSVTKCRCDENRLPADFSRTGRTSKHFFGFNWVQQFFEFFIVFHLPKIWKLKNPQNVTSAHPLQRLSESFRTPIRDSSPGVGGHPCRRGAVPWHRINEGIHHQKLLVDW